MLPHRRNVIVASSDDDAGRYVHVFPQYRRHLVLTPDRALPVCLVREYLWTIGASNLPASVRMRLRGELAPMLDEYSRHEEYPLTLSSW